MAANNSNLEQFEAFFQKADLDRDGRISGNEAVTFLQGSNLPRHVLAQIWTYADQNKVGSLGRPEFYNALKLVTVAQSKRELTQDIVNAALYGPASGKIPTPKINLAATPIPESNVILGSSPAQSGSSSAVPGIGFGTLHASISMQTQAARPTWSQPPVKGFLSQSAVSDQGVIGISTLSISQPPNSLASLGVSDGSQGGVPSLVSDRSSVPSAGQGGFNTLYPPGVQSNEVSGLLKATSNSISQGEKANPKDLSNGNGFASDSMLGDSFSTAPSDSQKTVASHPNISVSTLSSGNFPSPGQSNAKSNSVSQHLSAEVQKAQFSVNDNQQTLVKKSSSVPVVIGESPAPWPKMTSSDFQRYSKVFLQVDRDQDGRITGEQARTLFLSWRLPREVLKKVWDLSDQDNDSMLSLREFCIALYLMERFREGRALPTVLSDSVIFDQASLPPPSQPTGSITSWRPYPGLQQAQSTKNTQSIPPPGAGKPPRPVPLPQTNEPIQRKAVVPELEKHLLKQLSAEEQDSLNKKFEEAKDSEKKVADLGKEILEAKQKIQFYHGKMQELILYKSRCDNRLNEISERVVADKREADSLAKKYEEKYKQVGDVASKLTIEEATFRDIQERKMGIYKAIVGLGQENLDGFEDRAKQIQSDLEVLVKALNERCKTYGLRGKPTSLVELPFGWQPGIGATSADWDDAWDKFEDEGFSYVSELTLEVQNVVAPPKPKTVLERENIAPLDYGNAVKSSSEIDKKTPLLGSEEKPSEIDAQGNYNMEQTKWSPTGSPAGKNDVRSWSKEFQDFHKEKEVNSNGSPREFDTRSDYGGESVLSGEMRFDEPPWGSFDASYDTDTAWDINSVSPKANHSERQKDGFVLSGDDWGLNPIRTVSDMTLPKQGSFFDSVPSTPLYMDNVTMRSSPFGFADSVPSTPMYDNNHTSEEVYSFQSLSRFDSFNTSESGPFATRTRDLDLDVDQGNFAPPSLARFDSFRSTSDSDYNFGDYTIPFNTSHESQTPRRDSEIWKAF